MEFGGEIDIGTGAPVEARLTVATARETTAAGGAGSWEGGSPYVQRGVRARPGAARAAPTGRWAGARRR